MTGDTKQVLSGSPLPGDNGALKNWDALRRYMDVRIAAAVFTAVIVASFLIGNLHTQEILAFVRHAGLCMSGRDLLADPGLGDWTLKDYLAKAPDPDSREVALIGASYALGSVDNDDTQRLYRHLEAALNRRDTEKWRTYNTCASGLNLWSNFYIARQLRLKHPPDVMVVCLDNWDEHTRNRNLVVNTGGGLNNYTGRELSYAVPYNLQPIYTLESSYLATAERSMPIGQLRRLRYSALNQTGKYLIARMRGRTPAPRQPDATGRRTAPPGSWVDNPGARAQIDEVNAGGGYPYVFDRRARMVIDQLGRELEACEDAGIRVIVVWLPKNPVMVSDYSGADEYFTQWADRYGLELHLWEASGIAPTEYYVDTGHFFGEGARLIGEELAGVIIDGGGTR